MMKNPGFSAGMFKSNFKKESYMKWDSIYREGDPSWGIYRIVQGRVKLCKENLSNNRKIILDVIYPNELFGILDIFSDRRIRRCEATALDKEVILQFIPYAQFEKQLAKDHEVQFSFIRFVIEKTYIHWARYCELQTRGKRAMIYRALTSLALERGVKTDKGILLEGMSHQDLGDYIGANRQGITSALNQFRREGLIEYDRWNILFKNL